MMETSRIGTESPWPTILESHEVVNHGQKEEEKSNEDWEILSLEASATQSNRNKMHHCESTPNFGSIYFEETEEEESFMEIDGENRSIATTVTDYSHVIVEETPACVTPMKGGLVKVHRVPSFKDAILLNAQEIQKEKQEKERQEEEDRIKLKMMKKNYKRPSARFVVKEIKRCSRSTPDFSTLQKVEEDNDHLGGGYGGGGGGGDFCSNSEILGETDAFDFYARKSMGATAHKNGTKLRPDEAKRKEFSVYKKNVQRLQGHK